MNIGVFDSGIGGLNILKSFLADLPYYTYIYYGDNANAPYGEKSPGEIYDLTIKGIEFLFAKDCSLVILACNTASTVLPRIQQEWLPKHFPDRRVLGIIRPTVEHMIESGVSEIYLMATPATVASKSYERELKKLGSGVKVHPIPCPGLAKAIEDSGGKINEEIQALLDRFLGPLRDENRNIPLYLACTHYEYAIEIIKTKNDRIIYSQSFFVRKSLSNYLDRHKKYASLNQLRRCKAFFSAKRTLTNSFNFGF